MIASFVCGQSVYMHEAAEEAGRIDHFSLWDIVATIIAFILGLCSWYMVKILSKLPIWKIIISGFVVVLVFFSVFIFTDTTIRSRVYEKKESLHNKACQSFQNCLQGAKIVLEKDYELLSSSIVPIEVSKENFGKFVKLSIQNDDTLDKYLNGTDIALDHSKQGDGVHHCYFLQYAPYFNVYFFKNETNPFNDFLEPSLYECCILPCYIRYFTNHPDPEYDVKQNLWELYKNLADRDDSKVMDNVVDNFQSVIDNEYYWLNWDVKQSNLWEGKEEIGAPSVHLFSTTRRFCSIKTNQYEILFGISELKRHFVKEKEEIGGSLFYDGISEAERDKEIGNAVKRIYFVFSIAFLIFIVALIRKIFYNKKRLNNEISEQKDGSLNHR